MVLVCSLAIALVFAKSGNAAVRLINSRSAILVDMSDGQVLFEQNADAPIPPASITKVLTLFLTFEAVQTGRVHLTDMVRVSRTAAYARPVRMGLKAGDLVSLDELIRGMAIVSGNDAAIAVAEYVGGSVTNFVTLMNIKAKRLGMWNSHFVNPNGLPAKGQLTTARDVAKLSIAYLRRFPEALQIHSIQEYTYKNITRHNANRLLGVCPGVDGLKTGFVNASGYNLSATAMRNGRRLVAVVLGASSPRVRTLETTKLLDYGFVGTPLTPVKMVMHNNRKSALNASKVASVAKTKHRSKVKSKKTRTAANKKRASVKVAKSAEKAKPSPGKVKKKGTAKTTKKTKVAKQSDRPKKEGAEKQTQGKAKSKTSAHQSWNWEKHYGESWSPYAMGKSFCCQSVHPFTKTLTFG